MIFLYLRISVFENFKPFSLIVTTCFALNWKKLIYGRLVGGELEGSVDFALPTNSEKNA